jgi:hypothetical protein
MTSHFSPAFSTYTVCHLIKMLLDINLETMKGNEYLPQQICGFCLGKLEESIIFKEKSKQSQVICILVFNTQLSNVSLT